MTETTTKIPNEHMLKTLKVIMNNQDGFDMATWGHKKGSPENSHCGTTMCFAGWASRVAGDHLIWRGLSNLFDDPDYARAEFSTVIPKELIPANPEDITSEYEEDYAMYVEDRAKALMGLTGTHQEDGEQHPIGDFWIFYEEDVEDAWGLIAKLEEWGYDFSGVNWDEVEV
jgi:hypothetical protein